MSSRYRGATARDKMTKMALTGDHWAAKAAANTPLKFERGEAVRVKRNGQVTTVTGVESMGYTLAGLKGYFPPDTIEKV